MSDPIKAGVVTTTWQPLSVRADGALDPYNGPHRAAMNPIYVDFNNCDPQGRVRLNTVGTLDSLARSGLKLTPGMKVLLRSEDLETEGLVEFSEGEHIWVATFLWNRLHER